MSDIAQEEPQLTQQMESQVDPRDIARKLVIDSSLTLNEKEVLVVMILRDKEVVKSILALKDTLTERFLRMLLPPEGGAGVGAGVGAGLPRATFTRSVRDCVNFPNDNSGCPIGSLVDMQKPISDALDLIRTHVNASGSVSGFTRVPPLVFSRLGRGGKSTFLWRLFDTLKEKEFSPVLISFNGGFVPNQSESQLDALLRQLGVALMLDPPVDPQGFVYNRQDLIGHIDRSAGASQVVLLIDELNVLAGGPLDAEVSTFLKQEFLDKAGRYLVFTSHIPLDVDEVSVYTVAPYFAASLMSARGVVTVHQPHSVVVEHLRAMPGCESLTPAEVSIYGGIPSLIFSAKGHDALTPRQRFDLQHLEIVETEQTAVLRWFIRQVLGETGSARSGRHMPFYSFASMPEVDKAWWPLCYIACILGLFPVLRPLPFASLVDVHLQAAASRVGTGVDWELIVQAALMLRCVDAMVNGSTGPFGIAEPNARPEVTCHTLVGEVTTLDEAQAVITGFLDLAQRPTIMLFSCSFAEFPDYDGFVAYRRVDGSRRVFGHQEKIGRAYPNRAVPAGSWVERSLHVRGRAPASANQLHGWEYLSQGAILQLLGSSLQPLYPAKWPPPPAV